jgi:hypothetical protein
MKKYSHDTCAHASFCLWVVKYKGGLYVTVTYVPVVSFSVRGTLFPVIHHFAFLLFLPFLLRVTVLVILLFHILFHLAFFPFHFPSDFRLFSSSHSFSTYSFLCLFISLILFHPVIIFVFLRAFYFPFSHLLGIRLYSMLQGEANSRSPSQEISIILSNPKVHDCLQKGPQLDPGLTPISLVHSSHLI